MQEEKHLLDIIIPVFNEEKISHLFELLESNVKTLHKVANTLIEYETIDGHEYLFENLEQKEVNSTTQTHH